MSQSIINQTSLPKEKERKTVRKGRLLVEIIAVLVCTAIFVVPFYFIILNAIKSKAEAAEMSLSWPSTFHIWENIVEVFTARNGALMLAYINSTTLTVVSILLLLTATSMTAFVLQRRKGRDVDAISFIFLIGLMVPTAIVPTIWVLDGLGLFKTMTGMILVMVAIQTPFCVLLYRGFIATIPLSLDEAACIDGCGSWRLFFTIIFPMLKPVHATVIILNAVTIFNDFVHPLYFLPGAKNVTVQLTLYNFMSMFDTSWNLLFANVLLITIPPFILFLIFSEKIVSGMAAGSIK